MDLSVFESSADPLNPLIDIDPAFHCNSPGLHHNVAVNESGPVAPGVDFLFGSPERERELFVAGIKTPVPKQPQNSRSIGLIGTLIVDFVIYVHLFPARFLISYRFELTTSKASRAPLPAGHAPARWHNMNMATTLKSSAKRFEDSEAKRINRRASGALTRRSRKAFPTCLVIPPRSMPCEKAKKRDSTSTSRR